MMPMLSTVQWVVLVLFVVLFLLMGVRPFNVVRVPMQIGGYGRKRLGLHWFYNLLALLFWGAAWVAYPSSLVLSGRVERSNLMLLPAVVLLIAGFILISVGLTRNWKKGPIE
ncbi:hypothetical protein KQI63_10095 [bacterium]|nr:hypothetical protein [bacterium]